MSESPPPAGSDAMKATLTDRRFCDPNWIFERKLDGVRGIAVRDGGPVRLLSRNDLVAQRGQRPVPVFLYAFDLMWLDGEDLRPLPLRRERGEELYRAACARGWEGLIAKRADSPYVSYAGKVGTGFDRDEAPPRGTTWVQPRLVAQVAFTEWTREGRLRHPRFLGLREDKDPREVVREVP